MANYKPKPMPTASEATPEQIAEYKAMQKKNATNNLAVQFAIASMQGGHDPVYVREKLDEMFLLAAAFVEKSEL